MRKECFVDGRPHENQSVILAVVDVKKEIESKPAKLEEKKEVRHEDAPQVEPPPHASPLPTNLLDLGEGYLYSSL
jgi:hypothetical protein